MVLARDFFLGGVVFLKRILKTKDVSFVRLSKVWPFKGVYKGVRPFEKGLTRFLLEMSAVVFLNFWSLGSGIAYF